jgi:hypothetical protein
MNINHGSHLGNALVSEAMVVYIFSLVSRTKRENKRWNINVLVIVSRLPEAIGLSCIYFAQLFLKVDGRNKRETMVYKSWVTPRKRTGF